MNKTTLAITAIFITLACSACSAEPGSKAWCEATQEKPKGQWTGDEAGIFAKYCLLGNFKK